MHAAARGAGQLSLPASRAPSLRRCHLNPDPPPLLCLPPALQRTGGGAGGGGRRHRHRCNSGASLLGRGGPRQRWVAADPVLFCVAHPRMRGYGPYRRTIPRGLALKGFRESRRQLGRETHGCGGAEDGLPPRVTRHGCLHAAQPPLPTHPLPPWQCAGVWWNPSSCCCARACWQQRWATPPSSRCPATGGGWWGRRWCPRWCSPVSDWFACSSSVLQVLLSCCAPWPALCCLPAPTGQQPLPPPPPVACIRLVSPPRVPPARPPRSRAVPAARVPSLARH